MIGTEELKQRISLRKANRLLTLTGFFKILMIGIVRPRVVQLTPDICEIRVPLNLMTRNHFKSMYMGALTIGAELAAGFMAYYFGNISGVHVAPIFKSMKSDFYRRPNGNVVFVCRDGATILDMLGECELSGERVTRNVVVSAFLENELDKDPVANFSFELSLKSVSRT